ncbi:MAG TPA: OmpA family protein [Nevskiaceae bacterium]|nr:OmpA family protein [Nevskiaceae bacterium]
MIERNLGAWLLGAAALWLPAAHAVSTDGSDVPYAWGGGVVELGDSQRDSEEGLGFWLGGGMPLSGRPGEAIEISFRGIERDRDIDENSDYQYSLFGHWNREFGGEVFLDAKPYFLVGLGAIQEDVRGDEHFHAGLDGGAGLLFPIGSSGWGIRTEVAAQLQANDKSVDGEDVLLDFNLRVGLQIPLSFLGGGKEPTPLEKPVDCPVKVVDPITGREDCGTDSDGDRVLDSKDMCPGTAMGTEVDSKGCALAKIGDADGDGVIDAADACPDSIAGMTVDATGCLVDQTVTLKGVRFETGSAKLTPDARRILDEVGRTLKNQPKLVAEISGHTDDVGNDAYNLILSQQRAESVRQHLIGRGIAPERLTAEGFGETQPVADNQTPEGRDANRRVDLKVHVQ